MNWISRLQLKRKHKTTSLSDNKSCDTDAVQHVCKNCDTQFIGNYCPHCGQSTKEFNKPLHVLFYDFTGSLFAFDTRFFHTLKKLVLSPGKFSTEYMEGKRARYMKPFQFYIFISFIFFLLLNIHTTRQVELPLTTEVQDSIYAFEPDSLQLANYIAGKVDTTKNKDGKVMTAAVLKQLKKELFKELKEKDLSERKTRVITNLIRLASYPDLFIATFYKYLSWGFFIFMPGFALWLWLFFRKKRRYYWGHFIYSLELHSIVFLIFAMIMLIKLILPAHSWSPENYLFWLVPVYFWWGLWKYYGKSVVRTFFNMIVLTMIYSFSISISLIAILVGVIYF